MIKGISINPPPQFGLNGLYFAWRYGAFGDWNDICPASDFAGPQGIPGTNGTNGATGATGAQGIPGTDAAQTQEIRATTTSGGLYTWTYPVAYGAGVVPVVECCAEGPDPQNSVVVNAQVEGTPTNTSCKIRVNRSTTTIQVLGINVLSLVTPVATVVHVTARAP